MIPRSAVLAAVLPFAVSAAVLAAAHLAARKPTASGTDSEPVVGAFRAGLAVALGYVAGYVALLGTPPWPPISSEERLVWLVPGAALPALASVLAGRAVGARAARVVGGVGFLALAVFGVFWMSEQARRHRFEPLESAWLVGGVAVALVVLSRGAAALAGRGRALDGALPWLLAAVGASFALLVSRNAKAAQEAGALASALAAPSALALLLRARGPHRAAPAQGAHVVASAGTEVCRWRGAADVFALALGGLLLHGVLFGELPLLAAAGIGIAPLAAGLGEVGPLAPRGPRARALARILWTLAAVLAALAIAWSRRPAPSPYADWGG